MAIRIRCFPSADRAFFDHVHLATATLDPSTLDSLQLAAAVQAAIRGRYPNARISVRDGLAVLRADEPHWYAYRDGRPDARGPGAALGGRRRAITRAIRATQQDRQA